MAEKLIKSKDRVQKFAEVYTPAHIVKDMCDLIPETLWDNIERRFLEPACGSGNFLAEIFERKLTRCKCEPEGLVALSSIYGIDILPDNVEESRQRLFDMFIKAFPQATVGYLILAELILERNIICGDSLEIMKKRKRNGGVTMSKFDFDAFTGDYPVAVSKERYTEQEAIEIAKRELGEEKVTVFDGYVRFGFGTDPDDPCAKPRNAWWLDIGKNCPKGCCPVWAFCRVRRTDNG